MPCSNLLRLTGRGRADLAIDWTNRAMLQGLQCYHSEQFFEAHEHWEDLWRPAVGEDRLLLQALIQLTVAYCHRQRGNDRGYRSLLSKSLARLAVLPGNSNGAEIATLLAELQARFDASADSILAQSSAPDLWVYLPVTRPANISLSKTYSDSSLS